MKPVMKWLLVAAIALAAGWGGVEFGRWTRQSPTASAAPENRDGVAQLMSTALTTPDGQPQRVSQWQGRVLVVNFWATWCPPCREEMPEFSQAQDQYAANGVQFVGIAIDDAAKVIEFSRSAPVSYPLLVGPPELTDLMVKLGNQREALPYTVIIGRDGKIHFSHLGRLNKDALRKGLDAQL